jgi:ubiquinone/menaquinone biosynthesis C-methylase UbiE
MDSNNKYTQMQKLQYETHAVEMNEANHKVHNNNPDYWNILLKDVKDNINNAENISIMEFGCGTGRNIINIFNLNDKWKNVTGVDISINNLNFALENILKENKSNARNLDLKMNNGVDLNCLNDNMFDIVFSTIVFQHICVRTIRNNLMKEIYRVLNKNGIFNFQMGYDPNIEILDRNRFKNYYEDYYDAEGTNSACDTIISNPEQIVNDLKDIGFKNITYEIKDAFEDIHQNWIFVRCVKE